MDATPKAIEILCLLIESGGRVVSKDEIISKVWADSFVEEANLSHHIFRLRRALGENDEQKFIETVSKRGYRFVGEITRSQPVARQDVALQPATEPSPVANRNTNRRAVAAAAVLLVLAASVFAWFFSRRSDSPQQNQIAKQMAPMSISQITSAGLVGASAISPDGKFISYSDNSTGILYIRQTDTNIEAKLLDSATEQRTFGSKAFSADGAYVYYLIYDKANTDGGLYRISVLGGQPTRILGNVNNFFTLSTDGTRAAFFRSNKVEKQTSMIIAALDGGREQTVLTTSDRERSFDSVPAFSPDGKMLAFAQADKPDVLNQSATRVSVSTVEIESGVVKRLSDETWDAIGMMNWLPDATGVVLIGTRPRIGNQIYTMSYPQGVVNRVTRELGTYGNYGMGVTKDGTQLIADGWASSTQLWEIPPDGRSRGAVQLTSGESDGGRGIDSFSDEKIIYTSRTGFDEDLWTMSEIGGTREGRPLTSDSPYNVEPSVAPDGKSFVFTSDRAGGRHIFRADSDGSNVRQITSGEGRDSMPDISPDGKWVVYSSFQNNQNRIWKIPANGGEAVQLTDYESVSPSFSPDGKLIACIFPSDARLTPARLDIVDVETGAVLKSFENLLYEHYYPAPQWMPDGKAVIFRKNEKVGNLWKQALTGGPPVQLTDFTSDLIWSFAFSPDGKRLLVSRGNFKVKVLLLKNFRSSSSE